MTVKQSSPGRWDSAYEPVSRALEQTNVERPMDVERLLFLWVAGVFVLLPVDLLRLPLNISLVDIWMALALPVIWFLLPRGARVLNTTYGVSMWLILTASFISTLVAPSARNGLIVILKEVFVLAWFVALAAVLGSLNPRDYRRVLIIWAAMVLLHGFILVGQFISPSFWRFVVGLAGRLRDYEFYRPSGLFTNANSAALFQLLGFVPLLLVCRTRTSGVVLGLTLLCTMLVTGSMGSALAFTCGCIVAVTVIFLRGHVLLVVRGAAQLAGVLVLVGSLLYVVISNNERYQEHFSRILLGRAERSSESRFSLWERGLEIFLMSDTHLFGIGPENFRVVDFYGKQLHSDVIAFTVERGLVGTLGLGLVALTAAGRALHLVRISDTRADGGGLVVIVFLGAIVAAVVVSTTHQVFHFRELWMVLALLEAEIFRKTRSIHPPGPNRQDWFGG